MDSALLQLCSALQHKFCLRTCPQRSQLKYYGCGTAQSSYQTCIQMPRQVCVLKILLPSRVGILPGQQLWGQARIIQSDSQWIHLRTEKCVKDSRISSLLRPKRGSYFLANLLLRSGWVSTLNSLPVSTIQTFFSLWVKDFKCFDFVFLILPHLNWSFFQDLLVLWGDTGKWYQESLQGRSLSWLRFPNSSAQLPSSFVNHHVKDFPLTKWVIKWQGTQLQQLYLALRDRRWAELLFWTIRSALSTCSSLQVVKRRSCALLFPASS